MPARITIEDYSNYDASNQEVAKDLYNQHKRVWNDALERVSGSSRLASPDDFRSLFGNFRAAEQVGDAYFFESNEFIDNDIVRHYVRYPHPRFRPPGAVGEAWTISPEYRARLVEFLREHNYDPILVEHCMRLTADLQAEPVVRWREADWFENSPEPPNAGPSI